MPAYVIVDVTVTDQAAMEEYRKQVPGKYREPKAMRLRAGKANLVLVEGVKP